MIEGKPPKTSEEKREIIRKMLEDAQKVSDTAVTDSRRRRMEKRAKAGR